MKKTAVLILALFLVFSLASCSAAPSESSIQTAIAQTKVVESTVAPSQTPTPLPTVTHTPTIAPSETPTLTYTASPTPDIRIIDTDPVEFQLEKNDLPREGQYYLPNYTWAGPYTNEEVMSSWTVEEGKAYLADTGRISGYKTAYKRGNDTVNMPKEVECNVVKYQTPDGAQKSVILYKWSVRDPDTDWKSSDKKIDFGDTSSIEYEEKTTSSGGKTLYYEISFSYRNYLVACWGWGNKTDVTHQFVEDMSKKMLNKLKMAELSYPPTVTPTITLVP